MKCSDGSRPQAVSAAVWGAVRLGGVIGALGVLAGCSTSNSAPEDASKAPKPTVAEISTPRSPVDDCASQIDYWITTEFLQGKPDRGDYQEMGLGSAEGLALRQLEGHLKESITSFPAATPADLRGEETAACVAAGAGSTGSGVGTQAPVWP